MGKLKPEYRKLANPKQFNRFLDGDGGLANREMVAQMFDYDWHARKLTFETHFRGHVLMQATAYRSTRDHQWAAQHDPLFAACGAAVEISVSGLAQANKNRPLEPLLVLLRQVMDAVARLPHRRLRALDKETWQGITRLLNRTNLFDATTLALPPKLRQWAPDPNDDFASLKLQLRIAGRSGAFTKILLTPAPGPDASYFDDLLGDLDQQEEQIFLFDGGYWKIDTYHAIVDSGNHFVTKRGGNIQPQGVQELPLPEEPLHSGYVVLQDALVYLGTRRDLLYRMLRVRLPDGKQITLLSSLVMATADEICLLYHYRWTIEIIFRWLRQTLQLDYFVSHDPTGILRQILMALIMWGLLVIANQDEQKLSPKQLWRQLQADLHQAAMEFGYRLALQGVELTFE
ncbi:MAG: IS4 family transposase [Anaerolineae bacterium]